MSEIPRFDPFLLGDSKLIEESANGEYVLYADHLKELEELRERNRYLLDENDGLESAVSTHEGEAAYALERSALLAAANVELDALRAENERMKKLLSVSEEFRRAYQDGKYKLYAMGGEICEAAVEHLPMSEGPLDRASRAALEGK